MRHRKAKHRLNRFTSWRRATVISLTKNLITHQSIKTTLTKARALKPLIDKLISLAKQNSLSAKRQAYRILGDHKLVSLLFNDLGPRFNNKNSGYTRILKLGTRRGDDASLAILEFTEIKKVKPHKPREKKEPKAQEEIKPEIQKKPETVKEKPPLTAPLTKKPSKKFLGGLRKIFKKERDSL